MTVVEVPDCFAVVVHHYSIVEVLYVGELVFVAVDSLVVKIESVVAKDIDLAGVAYLNESVVDDNVDCFPALPYDDSAVVVIDDVDSAAVV